jgi:mRNA interferase MazF
MPSLPKQGSIYWFDPEPTKGAEIQKIRPCIVVSPDEMNEHLKTVIVVPLTSAIQAWPFRLTVTVLGKKTSAACDQLRSIDKSRLVSFVRDLKSSDRARLFSLLQSILSE